MQRRRIVHVLFGEADDARERRRERGNALIVAA